ncbi:hypothetical protein EXU48_21260 [Occultella glacieicola]|uniref:Tight adherence protein B n=1 Tax=Occultella glacieicola TaxID=2518684 RepID=A0ABY2DZB2_9MICO|nr:hypothetical protein [Occultella glacieicola]TDE89251.1 hypothetical protein EXU48_21260 [Occultella glacieicola]
MSGAAVLAALLGVVAVWLLTASGHRGPPTSRRRPGPGTDRRRPGGRTRGWGRRRTESQLRIGEVLVEVAARLRSGSDVGSAWQKALTGSGTEGPLSAVSATDPAPERMPTSVAGPRAPAVRRPPPVPGAAPEARDAAPGVPAPLAELASRVGAGPDAAQVAGAIAACRVAHRVGTPLADVLERCAGGLVESAEAASARRTALAGPRSTARLLAWLPLAGVLLGTALGADPVGVLLGGGVGGLCLVLGGAFLIVGRRWVAALVHRAERAGGA